MKIVLICVVSLVGLVGLAAIVCFLWLVDMDKSLMNHMDTYEGMEDKNG